MTPPDSGEREVPLQGTWPRVCVQRAFVEGAAWWQFRANGFTAFPSERDQMETEAVLRYGEPGGAYLDPSLAQRILAALRENHPNLAAELRAIVERKT